MNASSPREFVHHAENRATMESMAFGQHSGPPASHQQIDELVQLLETAGYSGFRDARGPMGFTQSQGGGKFTREEAQHFIDRLLEAEDREAELASRKLVLVKASEPEGTLGNVPSDDLATELRRRGWQVVKSG